MKNGFSISSTMRLEKSLTNCLSPVVEIVPAAAICSRMYALF
jgi:hypothetical protein